MKQFKRMDIGVQRLQTTGSMFEISCFQHRAFPRTTSELRGSREESSLTWYQNIRHPTGNVKLAGNALDRHCAYIQPGYGSWLRESIQTERTIGIRNLLQRRNRFLAHSSIDDEFRSSRNIALSLHRRYKKVVDGGFSNNIKEFITAGVNAYAVGCTDEGLRRELLSLRASDEDLDETSSAGCTTSLKSKLTSEEIEECILWLTIVFITILCTPQPTVVRWSSISAVSAEAQLQWRGFCALIANAYYMRGMAWLPVKTLQLEQMAVMGHAEEPALVADRMRLVFATLENVSPQWPKR